MERIVTSAMKVDLHIHSCKSAFKDGVQVKNNNINNLPVLINKLNEYKVNICSITDHDSFDYLLYKRLKEEEGKGSIKKVFPGVEFSVKFSENDKVIIHIVCIFNDNNDEKVKKIEEILRFNNFNKPNYDMNDSFSENAFLNILIKIDLDVVCIVHQKVPKTSKHPDKNDASNLGEEKFDEFIYSEYFEAFEYKNKRNLIYNNISKMKYNENNDLLRYITGSDCHEWTAYPKYKSNSNENDYRFTFLKCLPNFKGLALSLTDDSRISQFDNFFSQNRFFLDEINMKIDGEDVKIPLSMGINAIIGENSIGKSLLLHSITNYNFISENGISKGYKEFLKKNNIDIKTKIGIDKIYKFDGQGEIRSKFITNSLINEEFFKNKFPKDVDITKEKSFIENELKKLITFLKNKFEYCQLYEKLNSIYIPTEYEAPTGLSLTEIIIDQQNEEIDNLNKILKKINQAIIKLQELVDAIDSINKIKIEEFLKYLNDIKTQYVNNLKLNENIFNIMNIVNIVFKNYIDNSKKIISSNEALLREYENIKNNFCNNITDILYKKFTLYNYSIPEVNLKMPIETRDYLNYTFKKTTTIDKIDEKYLSLLFNSPLNNRISKSILEIETYDEFKEALKEYKNDSDCIEFYKSKVIEKINDDLKIQSVINNGNEVYDFVRYSQGTNSKIYFEIISHDRYENGIYIIDQPEDDVSQKAVREYLLKFFKKMGENRQVIIVTHNPQFVVNLDVDNVIIMTKKDGKINVVSGALEYEDKESKINILNEVANHLDGGIDAIRKRWKRYEKNNSN